MLIPFQPPKGRSAAPSGAVAPGAALARPLPWGWCWPRASPSVGAAGSDRCGGLGGWPPCPRPVCSGWACSVAGGLCLGWLGGLFLKAAVQWPAAPWWRPGRAGVAGVGGVAGVAPWSGLAAGAGGARSPAFRGAASAPARWVAGGPGWLLRARRLGRAPARRGPGASRPGFLVGAHKARSHNADKDGRGRC